MARVLPVAIAAELSTGWQTARGVTSAVPTMTVHGSEPNDAERRRIRESAARQGRSRWAWVGLDWALVGPWLVIERGPWWRITGARIRRAAHPVAPPPGVPHPAPGSMSRQNNSIGNHRAGFGTSAAPAPRYLEPAELEWAAAAIGGISSAFTARVVGQSRLQETLVIALLTGGHVLLESVPGLAKTTAAQTIAHAVGGTFHRIQCTPDLLPSDIVGTQVYNQQTGAFQTQLGPVHANFVLLDEINRSSAKTQSAMLEAMQERQTSIGDHSYRCPTRSSCSPRRTPSSRRAPIRCPRLRWTASCSRTSSTTRQPRRPRSCAGSTPASSLITPSRSSASPTSSRAWSAGSTSTRRS